MKASLFPHDQVRDQQDKLMSSVLSTIERKGQLAAHAPTGLGKTAAALAPAIEMAMSKGKLVVFMTSRLTQHALALETVTRIREKHNIPVKVVDMIGKKHMCLQPNAARMRGKEFHEYCKAIREDGLCTYYERLKTNESESAQLKSALIQLGKTANSPEQVKEMCRQPEYALCPYEVNMHIAKGATVVICDYSYLFNPTIREGFFHRINKELDDCILIIDEAHNLPDRVKELASEKISTYIVQRAIKECQKHGGDEITGYLNEFGMMISNLLDKDERYITKSELIDGLEEICPIDLLTSELERVARLTREEGKGSSAGSLATFLEVWQSDDEGFARIAEADSQRSFSGEKMVSVNYRCLDPAVVTRPVLEKAHSVIAMSGTLTPVDMYAEILGMEDAELLTLKSPFSGENRLNLIIPKTSTKYKSRSEDMYKEIGVIAANVINRIPGNSAVFFPSYALMEEVKKTLDVKAERTVFAEHPGYSKEEREELLDRFRGYKESGAVLLGVMGGSFSEGIDLPGTELQGVIIVGLPLGRPDLETKALIAYYDEKFKKGWQYGYTYPAFNRTLQSAGRCIRTENDRGVIVFLDERYAWQSYHQCFPKEWDIKITLMYEDLIDGFFG